MTKHSIMPGKQKRTGSAAEQSVGEKQNLVTKNSDVNAPIVVDVHLIENVVRKVLLEVLQQSNHFEALIDNTVSKAITEIKAVMEQNTELLKDFNVKLQKQQLEIESLRKELGHRSDELEQYQRRNNLRIFGVPESPNESTDAIVLNVAAKMKVDITLSDIDRSHRTGKQSPGNHPRPIIVKWVSYAKRSEFFRSKRHLKGSGITVREDLTATRLNLLRTAIDKFGLNNTWTQDGVIIVLRGNTRHRIRQIADLNNLE